MVEVRPQRQVDLTPSVGKGAGVILVVPLQLRKEVRGQLYVRHVGSKNPIGQVRRGVIGIDTQKLVGTPEFFSGRSDTSLELEDKNLFVWEIAAEAIELRGVAAAFELLDEKPGMDLPEPGHVVRHP